MMALGKTRTRLVAAIFTVAMLYASFCSTTCAFGVCPYQGQESSSHDCDHPLSSHSSGSHHHGPKERDCSNHHHPCVNLVKADGLPQFEPTKADDIRIAQLLSNLSDGDSLSLSVSSFFDLGSLPIPREPLYQYISVLRI